MKLTLGFSPCPNDTFIFDAMVNGKIDTKGISFEVVMEDVGTLNRWTEQGRLDITKLSFNAFLKAVQNYALLHSGSALGEGVGPMLIANSNNINDLKDWLATASIAIPGANTTANLLMSLAFPYACNKHEVLFSEIESAVVRGDFDAGLIIHESRFTYQQKGLKKLIDLGDWWETKTTAPIPLGGIVIRRTHTAETAAVVDQLIRESLAYAWEHYPDLPPFVTANAQEMQETVMRQHIELYVNSYTADLGANGEKAVAILFEQAREAGLLGEVPPPSIFY